eukprot:TRINITY_DN47065_c0_g1_i1.p1 TRINITY_DN47065_c0_g1~~TRINITY_DN47065_c0_g1_i1.p1  ORF type:complete len:386 (-),score=97.81 TRINITY_DN47065_c0_g1_i1:48-1205(-)
MAAGQSPEQPSTLSESLLQTERGADVEVAGSKCSFVASSSHVSSKLVRLSVRGGVGAPEDTNSQVALIIRTSLGLNVILFFSKLYTFVITGSLAVMASLVDSTIDLIAQSTLMSAHYLAERNAKTDQVDTIYPVGMSRVEPLGVIICAVLMVLAAAEVVRRAVGELVVYATTPHGPGMDFTLSSGLLLFGVIVLKIVLWRWCVNASEKINNVSLDAIALDNWNDVISNIAALGAALLTKCASRAWLSDPIGAILISGYIIWAWLETAVEQIDMLVGKKASPEFLAMVREMAETHDPSCQLDVVRAYHFGPKFLVEIELVMDRKTRLEVSHDVGMLLQHRIEQLEECERCFVHIDYEFRQNDDHDKSVPITSKISADRLNTHHELA